MPIIENFRYRADIDGLRAIAVLAVVLFHADFGCPGGYVGVDVFFVISGFLITSLIWKDLETGRFTFAHFWERRARRIVPPLVVVTLATLVAGWFFLLPYDFKSLGRAAAAQSVFGANIHYWLDSGYFAGGADEKPLLHTWSLAVEEQFYLIVPFVFWGMFRVIRKRSAIILILAAGFILSFSASVYGVEHSPSATFYLLPTRAWELLTGSILAFLPALPLRRNLREMLALLGLGLILIPIFLYTSETPFPGLAALPSCLGVALLIYANDVPTVIGSMLSTRPMVFVGLISYSLYLWHWIFFAYGKYLSLEPLSFAERLMMVGLGFLFAILSWKYVETPFRTRKIAASRKSVFAFAGSGLAAVFVCGLICMLEQGFPQRLSAEKIEFANAISDMDFTNELTVDDVRAGRLVQIGVADAPPTVLVWGDSHAMAAMPAFDAFLKERSLAGRAATHSSTAPVIGWYLPSKKAGLYKDAVAFNDAVLLYIKSHHISDVVLSATWILYAEKDGFNSALLTTIRQITEAGARPWVLLDVPIHSFNVPKALGRSDYSVTYLESLYTAQNEFDTRYIAEMEFAGAQILDPKPLFMNSEGHYIIQSQGIALYRDDSHLTTKGAKLVLLPFLRNSFTVGN
jgi:peptidoglycan/LPS O-acetylase OafA/YrhL